MNLIAHAGGTGWDEIVLALAPFLVAGLVFVIGQKTRLSTHAADDGPRVD